MRKYKIITYIKTKEFIDSLDRQRRARIDRIYFLFEEYGAFLPQKYLKKLRDDIWELRPGDIRLFLTITKDTGYVIHGIYKKSQKTPKKDIEKAFKRIKEIKGVI